MKNMSVEYSVQAANLIASYMYILFYITAYTYIKYEWLINYYTNNARSWMCSYAAYNLL